MSSKRVFWVLIGIIAILVMGSAVLVVVGAKTLKNKSDILVAKKLDNHILDEQQLALAQVTKNSAKYDELEKIAKSVVPQDKDQAKAVREIIQLADETPEFDTYGRVIPGTKININSIGFPTSTLGSAAPKVTTGEGSSSQSQSSTTAPVTQVKPVSGAPGLYQLDITVQSDTNVTYNQLLAFLSKLENNRRTSQVSSLTITPQPGSKKLSFTLVVSVYVKP